SVCACIPRQLRASPAADGSARPNLPQRCEEGTQTPDLSPAFGLAVRALAPEPGLAYSRPAGSGAAVRSTWEGGYASLTPADAAPAFSGHPRAARPNIGLDCAESWC